MRRHGLIQAAVLPCVVGSGLCAGLLGPLVRKFCMANVLWPGDMGQQSSTAPVAVLYSPCRQVHADYERRVQAEVELRMEKEKELRDLVGCTP